MTALRATHTPDGAPPAGGASTIRYDASPFWPGIYTGFDARCSCTRAWKDGEYQVKVRDAMCANHRTVSR
jgi:hypothetical protein